MQENSEDYKIIVDDVYKTFNVYLDKANTIKEKLLKGKKKLLTSNEEKEISFICGLFLGERGIIVTLFLAIVLCGVVALVILFLNLNSYY